MPKLYCPHCGHGLDVIEQANYRRSELGELESIGVIHMYTCWNSECCFEGFTVSYETLAQYAEPAYDTLSGRLLYSWERGPRGPLNHGPRF